MTEPLPWLGLLRTPEQIQKDHKAMNWDKWDEARREEFLDRQDGKHVKSKPMKKTSRETHIKLLNGTYHQEIKTDHGVKENVERFRRNNDGFIFVVVG